MVLIIRVRTHIIANNYILRLALEIITGSGGGGGAVDAVVIAIICLTMFVLLSMSWFIVGFGIYKRRKRLRTKRLATTVTVLRYSYKHV